MNKKAITFVMVAILLFTVCTAPPANAIVPAAAWVVWSIVAGATGVAVVADETRSNHEQATANNQGQDVNDLAINQLPHPIEYYQLGGPTPAGYVHSVEVADVPCAKC
ncbi:MAG: hypothetical protein H6Q51_868 [Deltaproteobacteria bacterium]|jgi:uncharacterized lipoprotein YajG|nr:hypothetical protein [Deltaproteobacteria bacterium]